MDIKDNNFDKIGDLKNIKYAILCHGITNINTCKSDNQLSYFINVFQTIKLLSFLKQLGITPIYLSTNMVYDGKTMFPTEKTKPAPILEYGKQKLIVENFIEKNFQKYLICRLTKVFGVEINDQTICTSWFNKLINNQKISATDNVVIAPIYVLDLVQILLSLIDNNCSGIFHISGQQYLSVYKFACFFVKTLNFNFSLIQKLPIEHFDFIEPYPKYNSLDYQKLQKTIKINFTSYEECFFKILQNYKEANKSQLNNFATL